MAEAQGAAGAASQTETRELGLLDQIVAEGRFGADAQSQTRGHPGASHRSSKYL